MIVQSLLDTDLYKITMERVYFSKFSNVWARFDFKCRNEGIIWDKTMVWHIEKEIDELCELKFTEDEIEYIANIRFMKDAKGFLEFLRLFKLNRDYIHIELQDSNLKIWAEGPLFIVSMFEIYVLEIVNEVYFEFKTMKMDMEKLKIEGHKRLEEKIEFVKGSPIVFSEFGTRRRFSSSWQEHVIETLKKELPSKWFTGTSNVYYAKLFGITISGTMAHEYLELGQALDNVTVACGQQYMLQCWADEYRGDLGTALTDNLGIDYFLKHDFDKYFSMLFTGVRHDSGDPIEWGEKVINHYKHFGIDPITKTLVFSDNLTFPKAIQIANHFAGKTKTAFGIGTNLTNDLGLEPLNIVFKMTEANGKPVAKLSDSPGKIMCNDTKYIKYLKQVISI